MHAFEVNWNEACVSQTSSSRFKWRLRQRNFDKPDKMNEKGKRFFGMRIWHEMFIHKLLSLEIKERKRKKQKTKQNY